MPGHSSLSFISELSEPGLKSIDEKFSEATITPDSVITMKSRWSRDSSCPAVLRSEAHLFQYAHSSGIPEEE